MMAIQSMPSSYSYQGGCSYNQSQQVHIHPQNQTTTAKTTKSAMTTSICLHFSYFCESFPVKHHLQHGSRTAVIRLVLVLPPAPAGARTVAEASTTTTSEQQPPQQYREERAQAPVSAFASIPIPLPSSSSPSSSSLLFSSSQQCSCSLQPQSQKN